MKMLTRVGLFVVAGIFSFSVIPAFASDCPNMHKAVMAYYEKTAKKTGMDMAKLTQAKKMLDDAMKAHEGGKHKDAMKGISDAMALINASAP
ncbi:MAG: hypothetical protein HYZ81_07340 [Nitrospinae bacterium]|nr:hypothetical protein [Nitrospinota bacterium]